MPRNGPTDPKPQKPLKNGQNGLEIVNRSQYRADRLPKYVVIKRGDWYVRRSFPTPEKDKSGKTIYLQITRKCEPATPARAKDVAFEIEQMFREAAPDVATLTVAEMVKRVLDAKTGSIAHSTESYYKWISDKFIQDSSFGRVRVSEVAPMNVQKFYERIASDASGKMIRKVHTLLSLSFNQGLRWELVDRNPCRGLVLPRPQKPDIEYMTVEEAKAFMAVCLEHSPVLAVALDSWARPGEYLALRWRDVDLKSGTIYTARSVSFKKRGGFVYKEPKTKKSKRTLELSLPVVEALRRHRTEQQQYLAELKATASTKPLLKHMKKRGTNYKRRARSSVLATQYLKNFAQHGLVFPAISGTPLSHTNLKRRVMTAMCEKAGIKNYSLYALRHTGATIALAHNANIKAVSERLGHASIQITLDTYTHVLPIMRDDLLTRMQDALY